MALETTGAKEATPRGLDASTLAEAFQITAAERAEQTAIRTKGDAESFTWAEYADRVRRVAAGLAALGVGRGETVGLMLTNRPEFHFADTGAMHLGAVPFSIYNTSAEDQIAHLIADAANSVLITEGAFLDAVLAASEGVGSLEQVVVVDGEPRGGAISLEELEGRGEDGFDFEASWRAVEPEDLLTLIYTSGTTGPPKGVQLSHGNLLEAMRSFDPGARAARGGPADLLAADGPHRRAQRRPLPADRLRLHDHLLPGPAPGRRLPDRSPPDLLLRGAADLGENEGGDGGRLRCRGGREPPPGGQVGARGRCPSGRRRAGRRGGLRGARRRTRESGRAGPLEAARAGRPRPARDGQRRRRADPARGDRVLPRARGPDRRALGPLGDLRGGRLQSL